MNDLSMDRLLANLTTIKKVHVIKDEDKRYVLKMYFREDTIKKQNYVLVLYDRWNMRNVLACLTNENHIYNRYKSIIKEYQLKNIVIKDKIGIEDYE